MKELIVLSIFVSFGFGEEKSAFHDLSVLKTRGERLLNLAAGEVEDRENNTNRLKLELLRVFKGSSCIDLKAFDDDFSHISSKMKKINLPLLDWMYHTSEQMEVLNESWDWLERYENFAKTNGEVIDTDTAKMIPGLVLGSCKYNFPWEMPKKISEQIENNITCARGSEEFQCGSRECIGFNRVCDGVFDCWDGSDELGACAEVGCEGCSECPQGFQNPMKFCPNSKPCYSLCLRSSKDRALSLRCLFGILGNVVDTSLLYVHNLFEVTYNRYFQLFQECMIVNGNPDEKKNRFNEDTKKRIWNIDIIPYQLGRNYGIH